MSRLPAGEEADAPGGPPRRALSPASRLLPGIRGRNGTRRNPARRARLTPVRFLRPGPHLAARAAALRVAGGRFFISWPPLSSDPTAQHCTRPNQRNIIPLRSGGKRVLRSPWHRGSLSSRTGTGGARGGAPCPGGDGEEGISGPGTQLSQFLLLAPFAARTNSRGSWL